MELTAMIIAHLMCNEMATLQELPKTKVMECSANFERVKIGLNPNLTWKEYQELDATTRAEWSVKSYQFYVDWKTENADAFREMLSEAKMNVRATI